MTREEWLAELVEELRRDRTFGQTGCMVVTVLPSFPARSARSVLLGDIAQQEGDRQPVLLVSPLIATSLEVALVTYWLLVRRYNALYDRNRLASERAGRLMGYAGFTFPFKQCVPTEHLIDRMGALVDRLVNRIGEYPSSEVALARRPTQGTRLLKVSCSGLEYGHDDYILRMSAAQYDRGAPHCGVCGSRMSLA